MSTAPDDELSLVGLGLEPGSVLVLRDVGNPLGGATATAAARAGLTVAALDPSVGPDGLDAAMVQAAALGPLRHLVVADPPLTPAGDSPAEAGMARVAAMMAVTEAWLRVAEDSATSAVFVATDASGPSVAADPSGTTLVTPATQGYARHLAHRLGGRTRVNTVLVPASGRRPAFDDTARCVLFLLSPAASYVTGTSLATGGVVDAA